MPRTIKFRIWDKVDKEFAPFMDGDLVAFQFYCPNPPSEYVVQQFTGMLDKNKKEIYEGDILKVRGYRGAVGQVVVKWEETRASDDMGYDVVGFIQWEDPEVIGNVFQNPELLKK